MAKKITKVEEPKEEKVETPKTKGSFRVVGTYNNIPVDREYPADQKESAESFAKKIGGKIV